MMFFVPGLPHRGVVLRDGEGGGLGERFVLRFGRYCSLLDGHRVADLNKKEGAHGDGCHFES